MLAQKRPPDAPRLPELRQELRLLPGPVGERDHAWLIYDPIRHRYFQVPAEVFELLSIWRAEPVEAFARHACTVLERHVDVDTVAETAKFMVANNLSLQPAKDDSRSLAQQQAAGRHRLLWAIVHNYLFFKIPLVRPERFLARTMPIVAPLYSKTALYVLLAITFAGLYFASRQWEAFAATFIDFLSIEGMVAYVATLVVIKSLHELGHAYTATRAGVRVNSMGVAFMLMTPILYTDVTDAWRLRRRRDKVAIDGAGIVVELALAGVALFLWAFLPDGVARSAAFLTATTSLVMGLAINLNPLMRFDGYYLLADAWHVPNLQPRSTALAQWWLRELLFGLRRPPPETHPPGKTALLIIYAFCVWVYRLVLFIGIALIVYHMFFKLLGVALFAIEIAWFILLPIAKELAKWWHMRSEIVRTRRSLVTAALCVAGLVILIVPWSGTVMIQAVAHSAQETVIFAPRPARVAAVNVSDELQVAAGQPLLEFHVPDLDLETSLARKQIELTQVRLARIAADETDRSNRVVLEGELKRHTTKLAGLEREREKLIVLAPHEGSARDLDRQLAVGEWIDETTPILRVVGTATADCRGYISEDDLWRVSSGAAVVFVPEDPLRPRRRGRVTEVVQTGIRSIDLPYLASVYGGAVPSDKSADGEIRPRSGRHLVRVQLDGDPSEQVTRGTLHISGERESIAAAVWRRILQVLVRESSA